jgi:hypothetical protein
VTLVGSVDRRRKFLLFIAKTYSCWELTFATDSNFNESSINRSSSNNDLDTDLTDTSELAQPLGEYCEVRHFSEWMVASLYLCHMA